MNENILNQKKPFIVMSLLWRAPSHSSPCQMYSVMWTSWMSSFSLWKCTMGQGLHSSSACHLCVSCTQKGSHTEQSKISSKFPALPNWSFGETTQEIYTKANARTLVIRICWADIAAYFHSTTPLPDLTPECKKILFSVKEKIQKEAVMTLGKEFN